MLTEKLQAAELLGKTWKQCESLFNRAKKLYTRMHAFLKVTGGGGDADEDHDFDDAADVRERLQEAKKKGKDIEGLNQKVLQLWKDRGWYALFESRYVVIPAFSLIFSFLLVTQIWN